MLERLIEQVCSLIQLQTLQEAVQVVRRGSCPHSPETLGRVDAMDIWGVIETAPETRPSAQAMHKASSKLS